MTIRQTKRKHQYLWLDLETTGLDPAKDLILEFAVVLAADDLDGDMAPVEQYTAPIAVPIDTRDTADPYVQNMHDSNGLWLDTQGPNAAPIEEVDVFLAGLCRDLGATARSVMLAGSSVHFDLQFCRAHLPRFAAFLSHRVLDVTTLSYADGSWSGQEHPRAPRETHRALPDILASLADAATIRALRWPKER